MNRDLDRLVDKCFTKMQTEGWSVEQCLDAYPEYRHVLAPLLTLGIEMHSLHAPESPRAEFAKNSPKRIMNQMRARHAGSKETERDERRVQTRWFMRPAYALASLALVIALLASGIGVVSASASSLPGDVFYGAKLARERLALAFSLSVEGDRELLADFAEERLDEAEALIEQNRLDDLPTALQGFEQRVEQLQGLSEDDDEQESGSLEHLQARLDNHIQVLQGVMENAPEQAREALQNAIEKSSHSREVLESVHGEGHPSENAPGQNKPDKDDDQQGDLPGNSEKRGRKDRPEGENGRPPWAGND